MRLICVPSLFFLITSVIIIQITHAIEFIDTNSLQQQEYQQSTSDESNIDDTSLFRGVENAIDEEAEGDDAYRIFKSLQDVTEDDETYSEEEDAIEHSSSKDIKNRIQPEEEEDMEEDMEVMDDEDEEADDEEEEEEEEEGDFSTDTFPEFKNEATSDFFEHLPQTSIEENDQIEIEEDNDEDDNIENHIDLHETEEEEEEEEELLLNNQQNDNNNNNNNINQDITNNNIPLPLNEENTIPWQRPDSKDNLVVNVHDSKFNQDSNHNSSVYRNNNSQKSNGFRFWHGVLIVSILVIIIKSFNNRRKSHHILDTNNSWNRDEKDYLPLHNSNRGNRLYNKWEIKSS